MVLSCPHLCGNSYWGKDCGAVQKVWVLVVRWPHVADVKMGQGKACVVAVVTAAGMRVINNKEAQS